MSLFLVFLVSLFTCAGQLLQKQAVEAWKLTPQSTLKKISSPWLLAAIACLGAAMLLWLLVLQQLSVSVAYPMLSFNFVLVTLASRIFFGERAGLMHWLGVGLIVAGIVMLQGGGT